MAKRRTRRRKRRVSSRRRKPAQRPRARPARATVPSAQTFFRVISKDEQTRSLVDRATSMLKPVVWLRDRGNVKRIENARTAEELVDLVDAASGLAEKVWQDRVREFGPEIVPLITERLKTVGNIRDKDTRDVALERLITQLRWRGDAGAEALMECFDDLTNYGKSQACVALGLLGAQASADKLWAFYEETVRDQRTVGGTSQRRQAVGFL